MGKANENSDKRNDVTTIVKNKSCENKQQTNSGSSNLESVSSSFNNLSENAESKVNKKADRDVEKSSVSSDDHDNNKGSLGNRKEIMTQSQRKELGSSSDGGNLSDEPSEEDENHEDDSDESDVVEHDVKVCDICGDAGREESLCICSRCPDGAEHTYCMRVHLDKVPEGDWLCEECLEEENKNKNRPKYGLEAGAEKDQSLEKDLAVVKISGKRRSEEIDSSSSLKKQALEKISGPTKDADRGKLKPSHQFTSDSRFGNESSEGARSPAARPRLESLKGGFVKSNSFNYPNGRSKTKLVDEIVLQRQKSTKERTSQDSREMGNSMSFRSGNLGRFGPSASKVKMLSPNLSHVQDLKSPKNKIERNFERSNSVKLPSTSNLGTSNATALTPIGDRLPVSSASNSEAKSLKGDGKMISGLKSNSRPANIGTDVLVSAGPVSKQLSSSPTGVGIASSSGINNSSEQKSIASKEDNPSKVGIPKESTNLSDVIKETTTASQLGPGHSAQVQTTEKPGPIGPNSSGVKSLKDVKNGDNKLKDAIEAALAKKPGIYRINRVSDQSDESSVVPTMNNEVISHSRNAVNVTSAEVSTDWHRQISQSSNIDHSKQSNGNTLKQPMIFPAGGKHLIAGQSSHDDVALSSLPKISVIPDHEYIWQGGFEINRSGKTTEFWDGLQAHLSTCASSRVFEAVNKLPHKILLNGVSRMSAWPTQFERSGVKEDNIALYFFARDVESYERSYQVLLDEMIKGDLALIGSINGVELLIFASNQLPERSNRWNMLFFLWGVLRGKKKNSSHQVPDRTEANGIPKFVYSIPTNKLSLTEDGCSSRPIDKDKHVDSELNGNSKLQKNSSQEKALENTTSPLVGVNVVPASNKEIISSETIPDGSTSLPNKSDSQELAKQGSFVKEVPVELLNRLPNEPQKRPFIDLSEDNDTTNQNNVWHDASSCKKQKSDVQWQNSHIDKTGAGNSNGGERYIFPLDLNEDVQLVEENDDEDPLSLSLAFSRPKKDEDDDNDDRLKSKCQSTPSMVTYL